MWIVSEKNITPVITYPNIHMSYTSVWIAFERYWSCVFLHHDCSLLWTNTLTPPPSYKRLPHIGNICRTQYVRRKSRPDKQEETIGSYFISVKLGHKRARPPCHAMWVLTVISALSKHQCPYSQLVQKPSFWYLNNLPFTLVFLLCMFPHLMQ